MVVHRAKLVLWKMIWRRRKIEMADSDSDYPWFLLNIMMLCRAEFLAAIV